MIAFFQWVADLPDQLAWGLFFLIALIMAIVPFIGEIVNWFWVVLSGQKADLKDFSYRIIPNGRVENSAQLEWYITNSESPVLLKGMSLLLCWHVTGARRIALYKWSTHSHQWTLQHRNCRGNAKLIVLEGGDNRYKIKVYFPFRKPKELELSIPASDVKVLRTFNLSNEDHFGQSKWRWNRFNFANLALGSRRFSVEKLPTIRVSGFAKFYSDVSRLYHRLSRLNSVGIHYSGLENKGNRVESQLLVKTYRFNPNRYNQAIQEFEKKNENIIN
jgi:hypothetical protein